MPGPAATGATAETWTRMQNFGDDAPTEPEQPEHHEIASTHRVAESGQAFTTHQMSDLRWIFRIDGQDSERTYPTAGEAERGAIAALAAIRKKKLDSWKVVPLIAVALAPVVYIILLIYRYLTSG